MNVLPLPSRIWRIQQFIVLNIPSGAQPHAHPLPVRGIENAIPFLILLLLPYLKLTLLLNVHQYISHYGVTPESVRPSLFSLLLSGFCVYVVFLLRYFSLHVLRLSETGYVGRARDTRLVKVCARSLL